jgi:lipoprotein-anchoring transpeptidase ErfK/SrfK
MKLKIWMLVFLLLPVSVVSDTYSAYEKQMQKMERDVRLLMKSLTSGQTAVIVETVETKQKSIKKVIVSPLEKKERLVAKLSTALKEKEKLKVAADNIKKLQAENEKAQKETQRLFKAIMLSEKKREAEEAKKRKDEIKKKKKALAKIARAKKIEEKKAKALERTKKRKEKKRLAKLKAKAEKKRMDKVLSSSKGLLVKIDVSQQKMRVYSGKKLLYSWKVSTGKRGFRTPRGRYKPKHMAKMHYSRKYNNAPMPYAVFFKGGYAIHGTRSVRRLGRPASHGCVRLRTSNAKKFYKLVRQKGRRNTRIQIVN